MARQVELGRVLNPRLKDQFELEVVSSEARLRLTRILRTRTRAPGDPQIRLIRQNAVVNLANSAMDRPVYVLELGDWDYEPAEYAWHQGELELVMRRPNTVQLVDILADLIAAGTLMSDEVNGILESDRCGIRFKENDDGDATAELTSIPDLGVDAPPDENTNIRRLFDRMDRATQDRDWSLVLHTAASIFETLAKLVVPNPNVQNQSLGGWFALYRNHSALAAPLLDVIEAIFQRRNIEPLAGHGSTRDPAITEEEAIQVNQLTRTLVRLERELANTTATPPAVSMSRSRRTPPRHTPNHGRE